MNWKRLPIVVGTVIGVLGAAGLLALWGRHIEPIVAWRTLALSMSVAVLYK